MKSDSTGTSDLERVIGKAAVEAARVSSQASQVAKRVLREVSSEMAETKGYDLADIDLIETNEELVAFVSLPGASKESIDLKVTEDSLSVEAKAAEREGRYLRRDSSSLGRRQEIRLPLEIKPEQVKASFKEGILEVHLPKLVVLNAQKVQVD